MRRLSIDITQADDKDYGVALAKAKEAGARVTSLSLGWDDIAAGRKEGGKTDFLTIANAAYPPQKMDITLVLAVLDTTAKRVPIEIAAKPFDAPEVIAQFTETLDFVFARIPRLSLTCLAIGNEILITIWEGKRRRGRATQRFSRLRRRMRGVSDRD